MSNQESHRIEAHLRIHIRYKITIIILPLCVVGLWQKRQQFNLPGQIWIPEAAYLVEDCLSRIPAISVWLDLVVETMTIILCG